MKTENTLNDPEKETFQKPVCSDGAFVFKVTNSFTRLHVSIPDLKPSTAGEREWMSWGVRRDIAMSFEAAASCLKAPCAQWTGPAFTGTWGPPQAPSLGFVTAEAETIKWQLPRGIAFIFYLRIL